MNTTYLRLEILRLFRNRQNYVFTLVMPVILYLFIAGQGRHQSINGISLPTYYLAGMIAFGTIGAVIGGGARISLERETGWIRQLKISPLSPRAYFRTKVLTSYLVAIVTMVAVFIAATAYGVRMPAGRWVEMVLLLLIGLIPFAALGIMLGHLIKGDAMGPVMGGGMSLLSIGGGAFFPLGEPGSLANQISQILPSYWLVQAGHTAVGGDAWGARGWVTVAAWTAVLGFGAVWAYRRDSGKA